MVPMLSVYSVWSRQEQQCRHNSWRQIADCLASLSGKPSVLHTLLQVTASISTNVLVRNLNRLDSMCTFLFFHTKVQ